MEHEEISAASVAKITVTASRAAFNLNLIDSTTTGTFLFAKKESVFEFYRIFSTKFEAEIQNSTR